MVFTRLHSTEFRVSHFALANGSVKNAAVQCLSVKNALVQVNKQQNGQRQYALDPLDV